MADKLTPIGVLTKWVVVPVAVGLVGYYVIGPRIGGSVSKKAGASSDAGPVNVDPPSPAGTPVKKPVDEGPSVEVSVQKAPGGDGNAPTESMPKPLHRKRRKPAAKNPEDGSSTQLNTPGEDQGGSAGATTAG